MVLVAKRKSPNTLQHRKRSGTHRRQGKDYSKPYLPYLPLFGIAGICLLGNVFWARQGSSVLGFATDVGASSLLTDTNVQRQDHRKAGLQLNSRLMTAAQAKANDMAARDYWSHKTPDGKTPWAFIVAAGYSYQAAGENLAYGFTSSSSIVNGWMNSPEHRANILNKNFTQVGFGIANVSNYQGAGPETIVVAMYAEPVAALTSAPQRAVQSASTSAGITSPAPAAVLPKAQRVARLQVLNPGGAAWSLFAVSSLSAAAFLWFLSRHILAWKRVVVRSENFIIHHRFLDIAIITVAAAGFLLTRTAGMIH